MSNCKQINFIILELTKTAPRAAKFPYNFILVLLSKCYPTRARLAVFCSSRSFLLSSNVSLERWTDIISSMLVRVNACGV